jgi:hypothetical protein
MVSVVIPVHFGSVGIGRTGVALVMGGVHDLN